MKGKMIQSPLKRLRNSCAVRVALGYTVLGVLWSFITTTLFEPDTENILSLLLQDFIFVFSSALVLCLVLSRFESSGGRLGFKRGDALTLQVVDQSDDGVVLLREDWSITDCSAGFCNLLGVDSREELIGRTLMDFMPERQWNGRSTADLVKELEQSIQDGESLRVFWQHRQPSGQLLDVESSLKRICRGDAVHILSVVRDMGSRLSMDRKRRRVERHNKILLELHEKSQSLDDKELYDLVLDHAMALTGSEMGFLQILSEDQKPVHPTIWRLTDPVESKVEEGYDLLGDLGTWVDYDLFSRPYINNDFSFDRAGADLPGNGVSLRRFMSIPVVDEEKLRVIFAVCNKAEPYDELDSLQLQFVANELHKIMKQRRLMRELEERESALEEAQRIARMGSWVHDLKTNKVLWSKETYEVFGIEASQSITWDTFAAAIAPPDREMVLGAYNEAVRNRAAFDVEHRIIRTNGGVRHLRERCEFYCADDGTPLRAIGTVQDITERVEWMRHIQREAEQNSFLLSVYERAEMLSDKELFFLVLDHAVSLTKSEVGALFLISEDGRSVESATWTGNGMSACDAAFVGHCSIDDVGPWTDCLLQRKTVIYNNFSKESDPNRLPVPELHRILAVPAQEKGAFGVVVGVGNKDEDYHDLDQTQLKVVVQELHRILSQRYLMRALKEREASLKEAQRIACMGSWVHDIASGTMIWTDEVYQIFGVELDTFEPSIEYVFGVIHPDDRDWALALYEKSIEKREVYEADYRILFHGKVRYAHVRCVHEYAPNGSPLRSVGTVQDVTDRMEAGEKIKLSERKYRLLFENMMVGFVLYEVVFDDDGRPVDLRFAEVNPVFEEQTGIRTQDVMGHTVKEVLPEDFERWMEICSPVVLTGKSCSSENYSAALESYFEIFAFQPEEGKCAVMILDVTDRKKALLKLSENEALQRNLIEAIPDLVWLKDRDGIYLSCNHAFEAFLGAGESEIVGKTDHDFMADSIADEFRLYDQQAVEEDGPVTREENLILSKTGRASLFESVRTPIWDARGNLIGVLGIARDIGWRKKAEDDLRKAKEQIEYILENTHDAIFQVDLQGNYIYVNPAAEQTSGYTITEHLGMNIRDLVAPECYPTVQGYMEQRFSGEPKPRSFSLQMIHKDGHRIWMELSSSGVYNDQGELIALQGVARDVTERVQMHQSLEKRLLALTRPSGEIGDIDFEDLFSLEDIQHLQDEFSAAVGVASVITTPDGHPITRFSNGSKLCTQIIQCAQIGREKCRIVSERMGRFSADEPNIELCPNSGLWSAGASIVVGGTHVASWLIGQVRNENSSETDLRALAREIEVDEKEFVEAFKDVPTMSEVHFRKAASALFTLANQISDSAFMNLQQARFIVDERRRTEELRLLSAAISQATDAVVIADAEASIEYVNPAFELMTGYSLEEVKGKNPRILSSGEHNESFYRNIWSSISSGKPWAGRIKNRRKDGSLYTEETTISPVFDEQGKIVSYVAVKHDITQFLRLEEQFRQNQKMEAIGRLASGVAHDFNNILQTIYGLCGVLLLDTVGQDSIQQDVREIHSAAKRAGELTKQLLTFSRKKPDSEIEMNLSQILEDQFSILTRLLGNRHKLVLECDPNLRPIVADVSQIEQVLMNLVINARDAMPNGGEVKVVTRNVVLSDDEVPEKSGGGEFITLSVVDAGTGMEKEVVDNLFEPFFTTKSIGEGAGLGLALIYSIVERIGGWIHVDSTVGVGSVFTVYFPINRRMENAANLAEVDKKETRILLVEEDAKIHKLVTMILTGAGYSVEGVESAAQAAKVSDAAEQEFDLLVVDEVLPDGCGLDLAHNLALRNSRMSVLVLGERGGDGRSEKAGEQRGYFFLKKPFGTEALISIMELALQRSAGRFHP
ncbi:MAG: PAS domain S-box protein [Pontiellaceae bacterium]|nr:PAS domain S-box protein [Pontiellaceae bacterium]